MFLHHQIISSVGFWVGDFGEWQLADPRAVCGHQQEGQGRQAERPGSWWHPKLQRETANHLFAVCPSFIRVTLRASHLGTRFLGEIWARFCTPSLGRLGLFGKSWHCALSCKISQLWWEPALCASAMGKVSWEDVRCERVGMKQEIPERFPEDIQIPEIFTFSLGCCTDWLSFGNWEK